MQVLVTASAHFAITSDGTLWTPSEALSYGFWTRYLDVYDEVHLLARAQLHATPPKGWKMASGLGIKPIPLPDHQGAWGAVKNYPSIRKVLSEVLANPQALHLRVSCHIATEVKRLLTPKRPYGVEVVNDPYDVFAPGAFKHPLRPFFRWWSVRELQIECAEACAAAYVTEFALQHRYPPASEAFSTHFSSIDLSALAFVAAPRILHPNVQPLTLISVGTLAQLYKAPDVLIDAVALCVQEGLDLKLILVGDGKHRMELEAQVASLGLGERVHFCGHLLSSALVRYELDRADLFILPSRQEGLPRAMIEAMARSLPCIGSTVGGIPELLPSEDLVPPGDVVALASKIREVVTDSERMARMSARNLETAKEYRDEVLRERRNQFYRYVREMTEAWLKQKN